MQQGYVGVGITVNPVSGAALKRFNPSRFLANILRKSPARK